MQFVECMKTVNVIDVTSHIILSIGRIFSDLKIMKRFFNINVKKGNGKESLRQMYSSFINSSYSLSRPICREFFQQRRSSPGNEREREGGTDICHQG